MKTTYLIEFYTTNPATGEGGWDINFAWIFAPTASEAEAKLKANQGSRMDCVITCTEAQMSPLAGNFRCNTPDANLFIIH